MEHNAYWAVLEKIGEMSSGDVGTFARPLEKFGLLELSSLGQKAKRRISFSDHLEKVVSKAETLEVDVHTALDTNLWVFGYKYWAMPSDKTLGNIVYTFCAEEYRGDHPSK